MYSKWNNKGVQSNSGYPTWNYKKSNRNVTRYSAGILPYTYDQDGKCYFLLGKDNENVWSDFGGRCEFKDRCEPINTAVREFYEETLGSVMSVEDCISKLSQTPTQIISKTLNGSPYYMYLMYIDNNNYSEIFNKTAQFLRYTFDRQEMNKLIEKNTIRWVSMDTVLFCMENQNASPISLRGVFYNTMVTCRDQLQVLIK
jgi:hypothetical protein